MVCALNLLCGVPGPVKSKLIVSARWHSKKMSRLRIIFNVSSSGTFSEYLFLKQRPPPFTYNGCRGRRLGGGLGGAGDGDARGGQRVALRAVGETGGRAGAAPRFLVVDPWGR